MNSDSIPGGFGAAWAAGPIRGLLLMVVLILGLSSSPVLGAENSDPGLMANQAKELFEQGKKDEALKLYHQALARASGKIRIQIFKNLGKAYGSLGMYPEARAYLQFALKAEAGLDSSIKEALDFLTGELERDYIRHSFKVETPGAVVVIGAEDAELRFRAPLTWYFKPGSHQIHLTKDGYVTKKVELDVKPGGAPVELTFTLVPAPAQDGKTSNTPEVKVTEKPGPEIEKPPVVEDEGSSRTWKWILMGSGVVLAAGGAVTWVLAWDQANQVNNSFPDKSAEFDAEWDDKVAPLQYTSYGLWGVGGAVALTGLVLLLADVADDPVKDRASSGIGDSLWFAPFPADGLGLTFGLTF